MGARDVLTRPRRPLVCKASLFELYHQIAANQGRLSLYVKPHFGLLETDVLLMPQAANLP